MKCMFCGYNDSKVLDSRANSEADSIRRRRECLRCGKRFTTYETVDTTPILIIKSDHSRQPYDAEKVKRGIMRACEKRPVTLAEIDAIVDEITKALYNNLEQEIESSYIGELVMKKLKDLDEIAYIRFACVYRKFEDVGNLVDFINNSYRKNNQ